jgi:cell cycle checkpoint protein
MQRGTFLLSSGVVFVDKKLFTSYIFHAPEAGVSDDDELPPFEISLPALLETLQIFGTEAVSRSTRQDESGYQSNIRPDRQNALSKQSLGLPGVFNVAYPAIGAALSIVLEEAGVTTTCSLTTYVFGAPNEIPFDTGEVEVKVIMQPRFLFDAFAELSSLSNPGTSGTKLKITASPTAPYLSMSIVGALGSATVEFSKNRQLLETFTVSRPWSQSFKFGMVKAAAEAMRLGTKVSLRGDRQGVLSLQFMVEFEGGVVSFVDYRFVPFAQDDDSGDEGPAGR